MRKISTLIIALAMLIAFTGFVMADQPVPAVFSKQSMVTTTTANVDGMLLDSNSMGMTITRNPTQLTTLAGPPGFGGGGPILFLDAPATEAQLAVSSAQIAALGGALVWHMGTGPYLGLIVIDSLTLPPGAGLEIDTGLWPGVQYSIIEGLMLTNPGWAATTVNQGMHTGILAAGEVRAVTTYDQSITAQTGLSNYIRSSNLNTANKLIGQSNFAPETTLTFAVSGNGGNAAGTERITLNTLGQATATAASMVSPFGPVTVGPVIPPYDDLVQAGGAFDMTVGAVHTDANERFIGNDAGVPNALNYLINLKGITTQAGQGPAFGSASGWIDVDVKEARQASATSLSETVRYKSSASAGGQVSGFTKAVGWLSGTNHV